MFHRTIPRMCMSCPADLTLEKNLTGIRHQPARNLTKFQDPVRSIETPNATWLRCSSVVCKMEIELLQHTIYVPPRVYTRANFNPQHCTPGGTFWATMEVHYNGKLQTTTMYPRGCMLCEKKKRTSSSSMTSGWLAKRLVSPMCAALAWYHASASGARW